MAHYQIADREWVPLRPTHHENQHWRWTRIGPRSSEAWGLFKEDGVLAALLSANKHDVKLGGKVFYRLDYLEIAPALRGTDVSAIALSVPAYRAVELDRDGLLFASFQQTANLYRSFGFTEDLPKGWTCPAGLVGFVGWRTLLDTIVEEADEHRVDRP